VSTSDKSADFDSAIRRFDPCHPYHQYRRVESSLTATTILKGNMLNKEYVYTGKIIKVVDGDTVDIMVDLGFHTFIESRFRLARIDTAEIKSKFEDQRVLAQDAKNWMSNFLNKEVIFKSIKKDKYGRYIVELFLLNESISLNQQLLDLGLAKLY
jgi:micrococcal nuclease